MFVMISGNAELLLVPIIYDNVTVCFNQSIIYLAFAHSINSNVI